MEFVTRAESEMHEASIKMANLSWNYESNITDETEAIYLEYKVMFYQLDSRNTKTLKKNLKCWVFINNSCSLVKLLKKSQNENIIFHGKFQK